VQDNSVQLDVGRWEYIPGTDITVPQPLDTFTPQNNNGSNRFTSGDIGNLTGFYAERGMKTTNSDVKDMYASAMSEVEVMAEFSALLGARGERGTQEMIANRTALIGALERLGAHIESGQATEGGFVSWTNRFSPNNVLLIRAMTVTGDVLAPFEGPLLVMSAPGMMNSPVAPARGVGIGSAVLARLPAVLRSGRVMAQAERLESAYLAMKSIVHDIPRGSGSAGKAYPIPLHNTSTPWYNFLKPRYDSRIRMQEGLSRSSTAGPEGYWGVLRHEGQHAADFERFGGLTHLAVESRMPFGIGKGFARYFFEHRGYMQSHGGQYNWRLPFRSFEQLHKQQFATDSALFGVGILVGGYHLYDLVPGE